MPRKKRISRQNYFHHIMFRGVNGEKIFADDYDRSRFCLLLQEASEKHGLRIHGFCFMSNHIHLVIEPTNINGSLQSGIHAFAFRYAQYFNHRHKRRGYLFQGRFRSIVVEDGIYLKRLIRYIHLNPLEAKIVTLPEHYRWSSYRAYLEHDHYVWLNTDQILRKFGETRESAIDKFVEYTQRKVESQSDHEAISKAFRKGIFGDEDFIKNAEGLFIDKVEPSAQISYDSINEVVNNVCIRFDVNLNDLISPNKSKSVVDARAVIALIVRQSKKWSLEELGCLLNKNSGTLSRLATRAEKQTNLLKHIDEISSISS